MEIDEDDLEMLWYPDAWQRQIDRLNEYVPEHTIKERERHRELNKLRVEYKREWARAKRAEERLRRKDHGNGNEED